MSLQLLLLYLEKAYALARLANASRTPARKRPPAPKTQFRCLYKEKVVAYPGGTSAQQPASPPPPASAPQTQPRTIAQNPDDYSRTIGLLETGLRRHWDQEQLRKTFASAFGSRVLTGERLTPCGVRLVLLLKPPSPWDERFPVPFTQQVRQTIVDCRSQHLMLEKYKPAPQ